MKKLLIIAAVALVALAISLPALASGATSRTPKPTPAVGVPAGTFQAVGPVQHVFTTAGAIKITVRLGSQVLRGHIGHTMLLRVGANATLLFVDDGIARAVALKNIKAGQRAEIDGRVDGSVPTAPIFVATRIVVRDASPVSSLTDFVGVGPVTAVDASSVTLTLTAASRALWTSLGKPFTVNIGTSTLLYKWVAGVKTTITLADVKVGDIVRTVGTIDSTVPTALVYNADVLTVRATPAATP